jgi:hypothetical protein
MVYYYSFYKKKGRGNFSVIAVKQNERDLLLIFLKIVIF